MFQKQSLSKKRPLYFTFKKIKGLFVTKKHTSYLSIFLIILLTISLYGFYRNRHDVYYFIGNAMFGGNILGYTFYNLNTAEYFLTKANEATNTKTWTNYQLSRIDFIRGNFNYAVYFANQELLLHPENCRTHYIRGLTYGYMERLDEAIADFEIFNECFPDTWAGHNDLAWFWFRKGNMNKVIEIVEKTINKNNNATSPWLQNTYGTALMNVGRYAESKNALLMAKYLASNLTENDWGRSYPGNDSSVYKIGLSAMRKSIDGNLEILDKKQKDAPLVIPR